jgi:hypothetical protein
MHGRLSRLCKSSRIISVAADLPRFVPVLNCQRVNSLGSTCHQFGQEIQPLHYK